MEKLVAMSEGQKVILPIWNPSWVYMNPIDNASPSTSVERPTTTASTK